MLNSSYYINESIISFGYECHSILAGLADNACHVRHAGHVGHTVMQV